MDSNSASVSRIVVHRVGNKLRDEPLKLSRSETSVSSELSDLLLSGYLKGIQSPRNQYAFHHETELALNEARHYAQQYFSGEVDFIEVSRRFANHLYGHSLHPNIRQGDLIVIQFEGIVVENRPQRALGLFKSEVIDHYLTVREGKDTLSVEPSSGINPNLIDKGALILEHGDTVFALDRFGHRTKFWLDDFLRVKKVADPITSNKVMSFLAGKVAERIGDPLDRARFGESISDLCESSDQLSISALAEASSTFVDGDSYNAILAQAERRYGLDGTDDIYAPSEKLNSSLAKKIFKLALGHDVNLLIPSNLRLSDFQVEETADDELIFTIRLRRQRERRRV